MSETASSAVKLFEPADAILLTQKLGQFERNA